VNYAVTGGTATGGGVDYTLAAGTLTFAPGVTTQNIAIAIVDDTLSEGSETIQVTLSGPVNATLGANTVHTYTITDNDPAPTVAFSATSSSGLESVTPANLAVVLSTASGQTVTVNYAVTGGTATGGGVDYTLAAGTLTFAPGVTTQNIAITIVNDTVDEVDETIQVTLSGPVNATLGANTTHTYTILDNDGPTVAFSATSSSGLESVTPANLAVVLSASSPQTITVNYAVTGGTATGGGVDYTLAAGTLTFAPGVTTQNIAITIVDDTLDEANETIQVTLSGPVNATLGANTVHTYTITDNDPPNAPTALTAVDTPADSGGAINLSWTPSTSSTVVQQRIYRSTTSGGPYSLVSTITNNTTNTFTNTGLTNGTTYYYVVRAYDGTQESANSNQASAIPANNTFTINIIPTAKTAADNTTDAVGNIQTDNATTAPTGTVSTTDTQYTVLRNRVMQVTTFDVSSIPVGSAITAAVLHLQYGTQSGGTYNGTNFVRYNNGAGLTNTSIQPVNTGGTWSADQTFNLFAVGVDTVTELQNLVLEFTNNTGGGGANRAVDFDYAWIQVTYITP
jgi:L-serine deaminase